MIEEADLVIPAGGDTRTYAVDWLWEPYLARGTLAVLDGDPGVGKSFVALDLAARVSAGLPMPGASRAAKARRVLVASAEDVIEETLIPRFRAAGGVADNLTFFGGLSRCRPRARPARFPDDVPALVEQMAAAPVAMMILDPMMALFPASVAATQDQSIRQVLTPFAHLAAVTGTCFLFVRHLTKTGGGRSLYRGSGSIGILGAVRSGLLAARHPEDPDRRVLSVTKANLGSPGPSLGYRLGEREGGFGVIWEGPTNLTADDLCRPGGEEPGPCKRAEKWLYQLLLKGPVPAAEVERAAADAGFAFRTVQTAKKKLGAESRRVKRDGREWWEWGWPEGTLPPLEPL